MAQRLEAQLEELKAKLVVQRADLIKAQQEHGATIKKAQEASDAATNAAAAASDEYYALRARFEDALKVGTYEGQKDHARWVWHPEFLERAAKLIGFHHRDRVQVDPQNQSHSLYDMALQRLRQQVIDALPDVHASEKKRGAASSKASDLRSKNWEAQRLFSQPERAVQVTERSIRELEQRIAARDAAKATAAPVSSKEKQAATAAEEKAKAARAVLRAILDGKVKLP